MVYGRLWFTAACQILEPFVLITYFLNARAVFGKFVVSIVQLQIFVVMETPQSLPVSSTRSVEDVKHSEKEINKRKIPSKCTCTLLC